MSFHSWSTRASLQRVESVALVKGGFLPSMLRILCLSGHTQKQKEAESKYLRND